MFKELTHHRKRDVMNQKKEVWALQGAAVP